MAECVEDIEIDISSFSHAIQATSLVVCIHDESKKVTPHCCIGIVCHVLCGSLCFERKPFRERNGAVLHLEEQAQSFLRFFREIPEGVLALLLEVCQFRSIRIIALSVFLRFATSHVL